MQAVLATTRPASAVRADAGNVAGHHPEVDDHFIAGRVLVLGLQQVGPHAIALATPGWNDPTGLVRDPVDERRDSVVHLERLRQLGDHPEGDAGQQSVDRLAGRVLVSIRHIRDAVVVVTEDRRKTGITRRNEWRPGVEVQFVPLAGSRTRVVLGTDPFKLVAAHEIRQPERHLAAARRKGSREVTHRRRTGTDDPVEREPQVCRGIGHAISVDDERMIDQVALRHGEDCVAEPRRNAAARHRRPRNQIDHAEPLGIRRHNHVFRAVESEAEPPRDLEQRIGGDRHVGEGIADP
jgi:hypothetical protein